MQTLRLFRDVARRQSFSAAAALHGVSQSAASQRIGQLEKKLGVTLLDRSVRPLDLTDAGRRYLAGIHDVLQRYDRLVDELQADAAELTGSVRVAAIYSSGIDLLSRVVEAFGQSHPGVEVSIDYQDPDAVHEAVTTGRADLGILSYPERFKKVACRALRDEEMAVVCPPGHALAGRRRVEAAMLSSHEMVGFDRDLPVGRRVAEYLRRHGVDARAAHTFDNLDTLKSAVAATGRLAILPRRTVRAEVAAGTLAAVTLTPRLIRPMGVITRRPTGKTPAPQHLPPATARFLDFLVDHATQGETPAPHPVATPEPESSADRSISRTTSPEPVRPRRAPLVGAQP
jgi:DNA-binding transcriptional LysR family regulator